MYELSTILDDFSNGRQTYLYDNKKLYEADRRIYAQRLARIAHGLSGWQGVKEVRGPKGLVRLANNYLKAHVEGGAQVAERPYDEHTSIYSPYWK